MDKTTRNILIGVGAAGVIGLGFWGVPKLMKAVGKLSVMPSGSSNFDWKGGLQGYGYFKQNVTFANPSDTAITINLNGIKIIINGNEAGYSKPAVTDFTIPARGNYELKGLEIIVPALSVMGMINEIIAGGFSKMVNSVSLEILGKVNGHSFDQTIALSQKQASDVTIKGLGVTASTHRNIKDGSKFNKYFPKPKRDDIIVMQNGDVEDTVKLMKDIVRKYHKDTAIIAPALVKENLHDTLYNIWNFVYAYVQYKIDKPGVEQLRRPARTWADRKSGADCDCMSIFISSILYNLKIPHNFRITKYDGKQDYQHVYVIVPTSKGKYITVDTVLDQFNGEKEFSGHKDFKVI